MTTHQGDCRDVLPRLEAASMDATVTDPPYGLKFMGKGWDHGVPGAEFWGLVGEAMRPGAFLFAFGGTRTYHRLAVAIEDAGFEILDTVLWMYGSGFPKGKTRLKPAWEPITLARAPGPATHLQIDDCRIATADALGGGDQSSRTKVKADGWDRPWMHDEGAKAAHAERVNANVAHAEALGRWPANVLLSHSPECREVGVKRVKTHWSQPTRGDKSNTLYEGGLVNGGDGRPVGYADADGYETVTAWECAPDCAVALLDAQGGTTRSPAHPVTQGKRRPGGGWDRPCNEGHAGTGVGYGDSGGASRFFYCAKASRAERNAGLDGMPERMLRWSSGDQNPGSFQSEGTNKHASNFHPTVKPIAVMRWLVRLVTPPGGTVLDPFAGSGTTGIAAALEGREYLGIEQDPEYVEIAERRIAYWSAQPRTLALAL